MRAHHAGDLEEATAPPDPYDAFADEAENRLEQDLLMLRNGIRTRALQRRVRKYMKYMDDPDLQAMDVVRRYKDDFALARAAAGGLSPYVPGETIPGDELREWAATPTLCGPLVCQLCPAHLLFEDDFSRHKDTAHALEKEYRKRVLYLMEQAGCRAITAQEKRVMVQNFALFQRLQPGRVAAVIAVVFHELQERVRPAVLRRRVPNRVVARPWQS